MPLGGVRGTGEQPRQVRWLSETARRARIAWTEATCSNSRRQVHIDDDLRKRLLAINVLLEMPGLNAGR